MVFRESPNPHISIILFIIIIIYYHTRYTLYTESTPNLTALRVPLEVLVHRSTVRRVSRTATHTHHYTILYTHSITPIHEIRDLGNGRFSGQNAGSSGGYASKLWATFETSLHPCSRGCFGLKRSV
jgi:hypothetical protein